MPKTVTPPKRHTTFRLTPAALALIDALARHDGISRVSVIEQALRETARSKGIDVQAVIRAAQEGN